MRELFSFRSSSFQRGVRMFSRCHTLKYWRQCVFATAFFLTLFFTRLCVAGNSILVPAGHVWKYLADATDQGTQWRAPTFDDSQWPSGPTEIGYGDGGEATSLQVANAAGPMTTYFRCAFDVQDPAVFSALLTKLVRDDGAIVYLNGSELLRSNMPDGEIAFTTPARGEVELRDEGSYQLTSTEASLLVRGRNVLAVEVHQASDQNPDMSFNLELVATTLTRPAFVTRGPYLQNSTPSQITVRWRTDVPTASSVRFTGDLALPPERLASMEETTEHIVTLGGLKANSRYFYAIGDGSEDLEGMDQVHTLKTMPVAGAVQPVHIWVIGDAGTAADGSGRAEAVRDAYLRSGLSAPIDVWLMLGDNAYYVGADAEYQAAVFDTYPSLLRQTTLWSTVGNHESYTAGGAPYFNIFTLPREGEAGGFPSGTENYYSFDFANIHFVCLDSMLSDRTAGSPMLQWLEADLAETTQKWIIAFWHHPPYTKGSHDSDWEIELLEMRQNVLPILEAGGVDLVLSGHSHCYERSYLVDGHYGDSSTLTPAMIKDSGDGREDGNGAYGKDPEPHAGAVYVVAGSAGQATGGALNHPVMFRSLNVLGSLVLDIHGDHLTARFLDSLGAIQDHFNISKAPLVTISAPVPSTRGERPPPGVMTLSRTRGLESAFPVHLTIGGTATAGVDYEAIPNPLIIPAGESSTSFYVQPIPDDLVEGPESVTVAANATTAYRVHRDSRQATVIIKDEQMEQWRRAKFGLQADNPLIAGDDADPDGDQQSNGSEFMAGTEPRDSKSFFTVRVSMTDDGAALLRFHAFAERSYSVLAADTLINPEWEKLADVSAEHEGREVTIIDPAKQDRLQRFYRVVSPRRP